MKERIISVVGLGYKGAANTGTHVGHLWSGDGTLMATAIFTNETPSGWQKVNLPAPVKIEANETYVTSYHSSSGYFALDIGSFPGVDSPPLHALANGIDGANGVFIYGESAFPTVPGNQYWVDVVFSTIPPSKFAVLRGDGEWFIDANGNRTWDPDIDRVGYLGLSGYLPVGGDWEGGGTAKIGSYDPATSQWYIDYNGNGIWDGSPLDRVYSFGFSGTVPVTGDWNGSGTTKIGVFQPPNTWYLDYNGNGTWDGTPIDKVYTFGFAGTVPVTGDWNGSGATKIGVFQPPNTWYLDYNGNATWDGSPIDKIYNFGFSGTTPVTGDWTGSGTTKIGVFIDGQWILDLGGNGGWDPETDRVYFFGIAGDKPVTANW